MPLYDWQERVAEIALALYQNGETMTFDKLADELGQNPRLMGRRVGNTWKAMMDEGREDEAEAIAQAFTGSNGKYAY